MITSWLGRTPNPRHPRSETKKVTPTIAAPQRFCGIGKGTPALLKNIIIDSADLIAGFAKRQAKLWLNWSIWWSDFAESLETGDSISDIRNEREREHD